MAALSYPLNISNGSLALSKDPLTEKLVSVCSTTTGEYDPDPDYGIPPRPFDTGSLPVLLQGVEKGIRYALGDSVPLQVLGSESDDYTELEITYGEQVYETLIY